MLVNAFLIAIKEIKRKVSRLVVINEAKEYLEKNKTNVQSC